MCEDELKRVEKKIQLFEKKNTITKSKDIYLFGVSDNTRQIINVLKRNGLEVKNIIDNDPTKNHIYCSGIKVVFLEEIENLCSERNIFLIYSKFWREMERQLLRENVNQNNVKTLIGHNKLKNTLFYSSLQVIRGKRVYERIVGKYEEGFTVFLCPYTGTGDIYLIGTFFRQYLLKNKIERYVFIVVNGACKKVADIFNIQNIEILRNKQECLYLINYYMFSPDKCKIKVLNDSWGEIYTNPTQWIRGYRNYNFKEMFRRYVFALDESIKPEAPLIKDKVEVVREIFDKYGLKQGKTVILSPYANTLADLPTEFWVELVRRLKSKGYMVCTNSAGKHESPIEGTQSIFFPLNIAIQVINYAGYFIGIRSGFCDVISSSFAKKIILYDKYNDFYNSSAYEYFSLNGMELCSDAIELQFDNQEAERLLDEIINHILK